MLRPSCFSGICQKVEDWLRLFTRLWCIMIIFFYFFILLFFYFFIFLFFLFFYFLINYVLLLWRSVKDWQRKKDVRSDDNNSISCFVLMPQYIKEKQIRLRNQIIKILIFWFFCELFPPLSQVSGISVIITRNVKRAKTFVSEASKPPAGARISKGPVGPLKF